MILTAKALLDENPDATEGMWAIIADNGEDPSGPAIMRHNGTGFEPMRCLRKAEKLPYACQEE